MAEAAVKAMGCLSHSISELGGPANGAVESANRATKIANSIEHHYRLAIRRAVHHAASPDVLVAFEMYRRTASLGEAIHRLADRAWYTFVKER